MRAAIREHFCVRAVILLKRNQANVLFFDRKPAQEKPWTQKLWIYDLRTNLHFTLKENTLKRSDLDDFVSCYFGNVGPVPSPGAPHIRAPGLQKRRAFRHLTPTLSPVEAERVARRGTTASRASVSNPSPTTNW